MAISSSNIPCIRFINTQNYRNLKGQLNLKNLSIFIGSNGSGKSNLISCLKFLKDCITPEYNESRGVSSFENAVSLFGGESILDNTIESPASVNFCYGFSGLSELSNNPQDSVVLDLKIYVDKNKIFIKEESLYRPDTRVDDEQNRKQKPFYYYQFHHQEVGKGVISVYDDSTQKTHFEHLSEISNISLGLDIIPRLLENAYLYHLYHEKTTVFKVYKVRREIIETISQWQFYNANNMNLQAIKSAEHKMGSSDIYLSSSGHNLPTVIANLSKDINFDDRLNEAIRAILPRTRKIRTVPSGRLSLILEWWLEDQNQALYLDSMSDGTVRMLCWATILHSPYLPTLLVIDEPELGLHVAWMRILAEWIKNAAQKTQIIITTHSPDLLDNFTDCLENVLCFHVEDNQHFSLKNLSSPSLQSQLEQGWELGDLYRVGDPSVGGWPW
jgi:predicted ATPase